MMEIDALGLFDGVGGWNVYDKDLGISTFGLEKEPVAVQTAQKAGHNTVPVDVTEYELSPDHPYSLLKASPPCGPFTVAGNGDGRKLLDQLLFRLDLLRAYDVLPTGTPDGRDVPGWHEAALVLEPARIIRQALQARSPFRAIVMEQTREVLPVWKKYAEWLECWGYSVWTGILNAEEYGVPQTRRRAVLIASKDLQVRDPRPTHGRFHAGKHIESQLPPAVSLLKALPTGLPGMVGSLRSNYGTGGDAANRGVRTIYQPAPTITRKYNRNKWLDWHGNVHSALTDRQASLFQTFPAGYPWQGSKTEVQLQIGNAIPPLLARAILKEVLGL